MKVIDDIREQIICSIKAIKKIRSIKELFEYYYKIIIFLFIFFAILNIFLLFRKPNYDEIIKIGERVAIFLATTTMLTFTYALALDPPENKKYVIESAKYLFKSFLYFIIGMVFSIESIKFLTNPSNDFGFLPLFGLIIQFLFLITGLFILIASGYFFVKGFTSIKF